MIMSGKRVVPSAGTSIALLSGMYITKRVTVQALHTNTDLVALGNLPETVAAAGTEKGILLSAGDSIVVENGNCEDISVDARVNGEGVTYLIEY